MADEQNIEYKNIAILRSGYARDKVISQLYILIAGSNISHSVQ